MYDKLTGREFIYYMGGLYKMEKNDLKENVDRVIDLLELASWIDKRPKIILRG